jgi:hypothetical protein
MAKVRSVGHKRDLDCADACFWYLLCVPYYLLGFQDRKCRAIRFALPQIHDCAWSDHWHFLQCANRVDDHRLRASLQATLKSTGWSHSNAGGVSQYHNFVFYHFSRLHSEDASTVRIGPILQGDWVAEFKARAGNDSLDPARLYDNRPKLGFALQKFQEKRKCLRGSENTRGGEFTGHTEKNEYTVSDV